VSNLYEKLKGSVYSQACLCVGSGNERAVIAGYKDVFDRIMSDSESSVQASFLAMLPADLSQKQRMTLLDGLAQEYQNCDNWLDYVAQECDVDEIDVSFMSKDGQ